MAKRKPRANVVGAPLLDSPSTKKQDMIRDEEQDKRGSAQLEPRLNVAVIGDVMTDWAFISKEPARPRFPVFKPWTRDPATHLFALPGGAWFSGHMIQGALSNPVFERKYSIQISSWGKQSPAHVVLKAAVPVLADADPPDGELVIDFERAEENSFDIIVNDEMVVNSKSISKLRVKLAPGGRSRNLDFEIGMTDTSLDVEDEYSAHPGFFNVDQVGRCYEAENVSIDGTRAISCTFLTITNATLTLNDGSETPRKRMFPAAALSLRIVPTDFRRGSIGTGARFTVRVDRPSRLRMKNAAIEVTFGKLEAKTTFIDSGKMQTPVVTTLLDEESNQHRHLKLPMIGTHCPQATKLWIYAGPGDAISMQHPGHIVHSLSQISKYKRYANQRNPRTVYRRTEGHGIDGPQHGYPTILEEYQNKNTYTLLTGTENLKKDTLNADWTRSLRRLVCIDDEGLGFSRRADAWAPFLWPSNLFGHEQPQTYDAFINSVCTDDMKRHVINHLSTTWFIIKLSHWIDSSRFDLLQFLKHYGAIKRTIVIVSGDSLRRGLANSAEKPGIKLAKTVSWERTIEDFNRARSQGKLGDLVECNQIVVRLGLEGALQYFSSGDGESRIRLWFDPEKIEGEYSGNGELGELPGLTTVVTAVIARELSKRLKQEDEPGSVELQEAVGKAIPNALSAARRYFDLGYGPTSETVRKFARLQLPISQVFSGARIVGLNNEGRHRFVDCSIKGDLDESSWSILKMYIQGTDGEDPVNALRNEERFAKASKSLKNPDHDRALVRAIRSVSLARTIVLHGASHAFTGLSQSFPFAKMGDLFAVDRREIQGLRGIRSLLAEYVRHKERKVPISVAVFGPPGSGKSFGVKQIARGVTQGKAREFIFNLAQFSSFSELTRQLLKVRDSALDDEIPLVFFDEFDCSYDGRPLGWLKFFLSPMQDGKFQHEESMLGIGKAIFVFAGGIASRHSEFADPSFWSKKMEAATSRDDAFAAAKGPDFHSRLRGYLDILGPNPLLLRIDPTADKTAEREFDRYAGDDFTFVIRRAILIRQNIERLHRESALQLLDSEGSVEIDRDLLDALLLTDSYKHGVRSMQALFEMSSIQGERALSKTAIPSKSQYSMHVDISFFNILVRDYKELKSGVLHGLFNYFAELPDSLRGAGRFL